MSYKSRRILQIFHSPEIYVSSVEKTNRPIQGGITTHNHAIEKIRQQQKQLSLRKFILCCDKCRRSPQEVLSSWNLIHLPFPAKKNWTWDDKQAVSSSLRQNHSNFAKNNANVFLRVQITIPVFYVIFVFWLHMSLKTFPASFLFIVNG